MLTEWAVCASHKLAAETYTEEFEYVQAKNEWFYIDRTFGRNRYYCAIDVDFDAGIATGKVSSQECCVHKQAQAVGPVFLDVRRRQQQPIHGGL